MLSSILYPTSIHCHAILCHRYQHHMRYNRLSAVHPIPPLPTPPYPNASSWQEPFLPHAHSNLTFPNPQEDLIMALLAHQARGVSAMRFGKRDCSTTGT